MLNLLKQLSPIRQEIIDSITEVLDSGRYILGPKVQEFESSCAAYLNANSAYGVASGTDALHLAVKALGLGPGDEVITSPFTFFATVEAILYEGAIPVFADIDPETFNIDPVSIEEKLSPRTKAIMPVHLYGHPADMPRIMDIASRNNLVVIEDCAQSFGATIGGKMTGSIGDAGCFSFYPSKNLGAFGDAGLLTLKEDSVGRKVVSLRNHGSTGQYEHGTVGFNSRLDEIQAAILLVKLKHIDKYNEIRRQKASLYSAGLKDLVRCPVQRDGCVHVYHQYTICSDKRDIIKASLEEAGISSMIYYPKPAHLQPALKALGYQEGSLPNAERASGEVLSLPMGPELADADINRIVGRICEIVAGV